MGKFSFKSSGKIAVVIIENEFTGSLRAVGIATPLRRDARSRGIFAMNTTVEQQVSDNLRNLIKTNNGERLMLTGFGADLRSLLSELVSDHDFETAAMEKINAAVTRWMPFVSLTGFSTSVDRFNNDHVAQIVISVTYDVPSLNVFGRRLDVTLGAM